MSSLSQFVGNLSENTKSWLDHTSVAAMATAVVGWLPAIAALVSIAWYGVRAFDWYERRKLRLELIKQGRIAEALGVRVEEDA